MPRPLLPPSCAVNAWGVDIGNQPWREWSDGSGAPAGIIRVLRDAVASAGSTHLFVTAAGNDARPLTPQTPSSEYHFMPAQMRMDDGTRLPNMLVVGATSQADGLWVAPPSPVTASALVPGRGSNHGPEWVDLAAPGADIFTTRQRDPGTLAGELQDGVCAAAAAPEAGLLASLLGC